MQKSVKIPLPVEYLDPLTNVDDCYHYAVPKYFDYSHANTRWLMYMIMQNRAEKVLRKMEVNPRLFLNAYYQMVDDPRVYRGQDCNQRPVFHRQAVLYFTLVGAAIYLGHESFFREMLQYRDPTDMPLHSVDSVQYVTHMQDTRNGDLHAFPLYVIMMRCCQFDCALTMLRHGWDPHKPLAMPLRRGNERRALCVADWLDSALGLLTQRPAYPLSALVLGMARDANLWRHSRMPMIQYLQRNRIRDDQQQAPQEQGQQYFCCGLVDVDELPARGTRLLGVRTLAELVKDYDRFKQAKRLHANAMQQLRRAEAFGINREILLAQCQDYSSAFFPESESPPVASAAAPSPEVCQSSNQTDSRGQREASSAGFQEPPTLSASPTASEASPTASSASPLASAASPTAPTPNTAGRNSSAQQVLICERKTPVPIYYASEPVRILHYALKCDKSTVQCMATVDVYVRRNFYLTSMPLPAGSPERRDACNAVVLLLNLLQKQLTELQGIVQQGFDTAKSGVGTAANVSLHRRLACLRTINKLTQLLTAVLLHSKLFIEFALSDRFPPYPASEVDFAYAGDLASNYNDIRLGVASEFNDDPKSFRHLGLNMLRQLRAARTTLPGALRLQLKLGQRPLTLPKVKKEEPEKARCCRKARKDKDSSTGCCRSSKTQNSAKANNMYSNSLMLRLKDVDRPRLPSPRVTFIRVQRQVRLRRNSNSTTMASLLTPVLSDFDQGSESLDESPAKEDINLVKIPSCSSLVNLLSIGTLTSEVKASTPERATPPPQPPRGRIGGMARWLAKLGRRACTRGWNSAKQKRVTYVTASNA